jgi:iron complex transport system ATP-binding protein
MPEDRPALLDLQNIRVMRGAKVVLDDFSLQIQPTEHVAILGPNGCGKSTLVKAIAREIYPVVREGSSMTILGRDRWDVFALRSLLGIVSNDLMTACTTDVKGRDVVISGFFSSTRIFPHHTIDPTHRQLAESALERMQVSHLADRRMFELSSGEAKRVLIARALVHKPSALLFDEPSNSLDLRAQHYLRESMRMLANSGIGIVLVTHDLRDLVPEIERVVLMSQGKIAADGHKEKVLQGDRLSSLFGMKVDLAQRDGYYHLW